ncbi:DUF885 domain-containing protein [Flavobacterium sp. 3HN19-14]|uniref:DUF885 domain-containing protein n=1 Tax=Flavobacterium sp. 3HN19-14 TaxID=3448133 RepID=UPI003EE3E8EA
MKKIIIAVIVLAIGFQSCKKEGKDATKEVKEDNKELAAILENYYQEKMKYYPIDATFAGENKFNNLLPNTLDDAVIAEIKSFFTKYKNEISKFDDADLSANDKMSKALLSWECNINLEGFTFHEEYLPINQFQSLPLMIGQLAGGTSAQPFKTVKDYENWLERLSGFNNWVISAKARMKEGVAKGYVLPKALTEKVIPQIGDLAKDGQSNIFYSPLHAFPADFSKADKDRLTVDYTKLLTEKLLPSLKSLHDYIASDYLKASRTSSGISGITNGIAYYNFLVKKYTTTDLTPDQIHQIGLKEVARIMSEMEKVKAEVGYKGDLISFFDYVREKKELMPFTEPQQVLDNFKAIHEKMKPNLDKLFDMKPKTAFEIRRTEAFREASASAEYNQGSVDGTRPGFFMYRFRMLKNIMFILMKICSCMKQFRTPLPGFIATGKYCIAIFQEDHLVQFLW